MPTAFEFTKTDEQRKILSFNASTLELGRPWLAPPNIPAERVAALRAAFDATMQDETFRAEAKQRGLEVTLRTGAELEAVLAEAAAFPPDLLARIPQLIGRYERRRMGMVQLGGFEPPTSGSTNRRSNQLSYSCTTTCTW